jgi:hypothetical protein
MLANRFFLLGMFGLMLMTICGSQIASDMSLRGLAQWPIGGFAAGIIFASQTAIGRLLDRISELEKKIDGGKSA